MKRHVKIKCRGADVPERLTKIDSGGVDDDVAQLGRGRASIVSTILGAALSDARSAAIRIAEECHLPICAVMLPLPEATQRDVHQCNFRTRKAERPRHRKTDAAVAARYERGAPGKIVKERSELEDHQTLDG